MSFILDALKKSEAARQRQSVPGLLDLPATIPKRRFPVWGLALGLLLGVNLLVLLVVLVRGSNHTAAPALSATTRELPLAPAAGPQTAAAAPARPLTESAPFSPMQAPPVYAPEIPVAETLVAPVTPLDGQVSAANSVQPAPRQPLPPQAQIPIDPNEIVPTLQEVNLSGNRGIPELHLDIHVYAAKSAERFVFINNRKYREGSTLQEGPTVERISRDGVILSYQNLRFSIPRM